jgi:hypothetical protein
VTSVVRKHIHTQMHTHIHAHARARAHMNKYTHRHTWIRTYTCTSIHTHTHLWPLGYEQSNLHVFLFLRLKIFLPDQHDVLSLAVLLCTVLYIQVRALPIAVLRPVAGAAEAISYALLGKGDMRDNRRGRNAFIPPLISLSSSLLYSSPPLSLSPLYFLISPLLAATPGMRNSLDPDSRRDEEDIWNLEFDTRPLPKIKGPI